MVARKDVYVRGVRCLLVPVFQQVFHLRDQQTTCIVKFWMTLSATFLRQLYEIANLGRASRQQHLPLLFGACGEGGWSWLAETRTKPYIIKQIKIIKNVCLRMLSNSPDAHGHVWQPEPCSSHTLPSPFGLPLLLVSLTPRSFPASASRLERGLLR